MELFSHCLLYFNCYLSKGSFSLKRLLHYFGARFLIPLSKQGTLSTFWKRDLKCWALFIICAEAQEAKKIRFFLLTKKKKKREAHLWTYARKIYSFYFFPLFFFSYLFFFSWYYLQWITATFSGVPKREIINWGRRCLKYNWSFKKTKGVFLKSLFFFYY